MSGKPSLQTLLPPMEDPVFLIKAVLKELETVSDNTETSKRLLERLQRLLDLLEPEETPVMRPAVKLRAILLWLTKTTRAMTSALTSAGKDLRSMEDEISRLRAQIASQQAMIEQHGLQVGQQTRMMGALMAETKSVRQELRAVLSLFPEAED